MWEFLSQNLTLGMSGCCGQPKRGADTRGGPLTDTEPISEVPAYELGQQAPCMNLNLLTCIHGKEGLSDINKWNGNWQSHFGKPVSAADAHAHQLCPGNSTPEESAHRCTGGILALTFCKSVRWQHTKRYHFQLVEEQPSQANRDLGGPFYCSSQWSPENQLWSMKLTK